MKRYTFKLNEEVSGEIVVDKPLVRCVLNLRGTPLKQTAHAKCSEDDEWNHFIGVSIALSRSMERLDRKIRRRQRRFKRAAEGLCVNLWKAI